MAELFSGIGGWSQAAKMAGGINVTWYADIHTYKNQVYELRHPGARNYGDIRNIEQPEYADIYTVSFPCTGISTAGKGKGLADANSGLWFDAEVIIGRGRPKYVVIENGPALTIRGLHRILAGLAALGYDAEWTHLSGTQFGIQQRRKRLYLIAYTTKSRQPRIMWQGSIFREIKTGYRVHAMPVYPGWRERRDIPEPRTIRSAYDFPSLVHRLECVGDAIIPLIGMYILDCIKIHHYDTLRHH